MKDGAFGLFRSISSLSAKIGSKAEGLRSNLEEGVEVLKNVASDIRLEIRQKETPTLQMVANHFLRYVILLLNQAAVEAKQLSRYLAYEAQALFKANVILSEDIESKAESNGQE